MSTHFNEIFSDDIISIKLFKPSIFRLFGGKLRKLGLRQKIRFYLNLIRGYRVYHLFKNNIEIGYCVITNGGSRRYPFADKNDIIVGPYFIDEKYRGKKLSIFLVKKCLIDFEKNYIAAYDFIKKDNIISIKTTEASGFNYYSDAFYTKYLRVLKPMEDKSGTFLIYQYVSKNKNNNKKGKKNE